MAKRIYKYPVPGKITAPVWRWLQPRMQYGVPVVWAELDDEADVHDWIIVYVGTGWEIDENDELYKVMEEGHYCGTVEDGAYIWHVYACRADLCGQ